MLVGILNDVVRGDRAAADRVPPASAETRATPRSTGLCARSHLSLHAGNGAKAAAEFQRILDHRAAWCPPRRSIRSRMRARRRIRA